MNCHSEQDLAGRNVHSLQQATDQRQDRAIILPVRRYDAGGLEKGYTFWLS